MPVIQGRTIGEIYLERIRSTPHTVGFQYKPMRAEEGNTTTSWKRITFREFDAECRLVSFGLMALGIKPGDRAAIIAHTRYEWPLADLAILGASAVTVPVYPSLLGADMAQILSHSGARFAFVEGSRELERLLAARGSTPGLEKIIVLEPSAMKLAAGIPEIITLQALKEMGRREEARTPQRFETNLSSAKPDDLLTICYTSGTTGIPKGAMISHANMVSVLEDCATVLGRHVRSEEEVLLAFLPFSHILGKVESMGTWVFGWRHCFAENMDALMQNMADVSPTLIFAVPRIFEKAWARIEQTVRKSSKTRQRLYGWGHEIARRYYGNVWKRRDPGAILGTQYKIAKAVVFSPISDRFGGRLKFAICGGAPLPREMAEYFERAGLNILEGYGLTETCGPITVNSPDFHRIGSVGRPLPEVSIKIADDGEILIKSRKVFTGYFGMPEETGEVLRDGWLHTGDIGHLDSEGFLHITDRKKDLIVTSGGKNIAPQKIENLARAAKFISQLVVHGDRRHFLTALVTLDREQVIKYAQENQILFSGYPELVRHPKIQGLIQRQIDEINAHLAQHEAIRRFILLPSDFTVESGELTPSLKVRRRLIEQRYRAELDSMYS